MNHELRVKNFAAAAVALVAFLIAAVPAFAHVTVKPNQAGVASYTDFTLGVPSEKDAATIGVKLMIPDGINFVSPIVKPGWKVEIVNSSKQGEPDDDGNVNPIPKAIVWTGGSVPAHQKDFFMFSTQVPAKETELDWKVEQTYADGSLVSWSLAADQQPKDEKGNPDFSKFGPYSKTMVVNDLTDTQTVTGDSMRDEEGNEKASALPMVLSVIALLGASVSLLAQFRRKQV